MLEFWVCCFFWDNILNSGCRNAAELLHLSSNLDAVFFFLILPLKNIICWKGKCKLTKLQEIYGSDYPLFTRALQLILIQLDAGIYALYQGLLR